MSRNSHSIVWGRHAVLEALRARLVVSILLSNSQRPSADLKCILQEAQRAHIEVARVTETQLARIAPSQRTQGIVAYTHGPRLVTTEQLLQIASKSGMKPFLVALDQVQDPHNVGALLRSADAAGVHGVVLTERHTAPLSGTVAQVSAGAVSHLAIAQPGNLSAALRALRAAGIWTIGLDGDAQQTLFDVDLDVPLTLVVGNEGAGMRRLTRESCDMVVRLPMFGDVASLNVSVAGSIAMYEVVRQRHARDRADVR